MGNRSSDLKYHMNDPTPFGYVEFVSNETYHDLSGNEKRKVVARIYSKRIEQILLKELQRLGVYE